MEQKRSFLARPVVAALLASLCAILWGSAYPAIKSGYTLFSVGGDDTAAKMAFAGLRFVVSGLLVFLFRAFQRGEKQPLSSLDGKDWTKIGALSLVQTTVHYTFFYIGVSYISGAKSSILNASTVFFSALLAHFAYTNDKVTVKKAIGILLGFAAVILVNLDDSLGFSFTVTGEGFILIAAFLHSFSALFSKRLSRRIDPVLMTALQLFIGGFLLLLIGLIMGSPFPRSTASGYLLLGYLAALSAIAFSLWTLLLKYNKVSSITIFNFLIPVSGTLLSALFLGESVLRLEYLVSLPLVVAGIVLVTHSRDVP
ncbi:MAG TPA: DMT family transporter [Sphaerochaeta sp.]|jgi:drug/metabolite transporter (DMT)-like permease|nr:DMT family transporter [Spirochaetota bacterium]HOE84476.1 DMT family transporter [Sphaerochaeta sp.]HOQ94243.1 DMT family transporter [Sphaerochaeta sp.]HPK47057.1 DMT family transporter [Sphaerochaeta sp.]HPY11397.1 DMT family transporter [Sphaerochaeta sp.]